MSSMALLLYSMLLYIIVAPIHCYDPYPFFLPRSIKPSSPLLGTPPLPQPQTQTQINSPSSLSSTGSPTTAPATSPTPATPPHSKIFDVIILGSGPASLSLASLFPPSTSVAICDANFNRSWVPTFGIWEDEWQSLTNLFKTTNNVSVDISLCYDKKWDSTECFFGGSWDIPDGEKFAVDRSYLRIDKIKLREAFLSSSSSHLTVVEANCISATTSNPNIFTPDKSIVHLQSHSEMRLSNGETIRGKIVVDCTGAESKLTSREGPGSQVPKGYQIAYGLTAKLKSGTGPYAKDKMLLFDYRTDHLEPGDASVSGSKEPTFLYAMPLSEDKMFFEETSLVANPGVSAALCKERLTKRLEFHGIGIEEVEDEEFCYIPMGGGLPTRGQRIIAHGGAGGLTHPATGYTINRMLAASTKLATRIQSELDSDDSFDADKTARRCYDEVWSEKLIMERNFAVFGGDFLMRQNVKGLRGFFSGFFQLPKESWGGFLSHYDGLPNNDKHQNWNDRLVFGLLFLTKLPFPVAVDLFVSIVRYSLQFGIDLPQSVTPIFGAVTGYDANANANNDEVVKDEIRAMIKQSKVKATQSTTTNYAYVSNKKKE